jgi:hypothetical protein
MKLIKTIGISMLVFLTSCGHSLSDVNVGMTKDEVEDLLGRPNKTNTNSSSYTSTTGESESFSTTVWKYNNQDGYIKFENGIVVNVTAE